MSELRSYLDLGLLAKVPPIGTSLRIPTSVGIAVSLAAVGAMFLLEGGWLVGVATVWAVVIAGTDVDASSLGWLMPPLTRVFEYGLVIVVALEADISGPLLFAYLGAVAYHHYDVVHRFSVLGSGPNWLLGAMLGGSGVRSIAVAVAAAFGVLPVWLVVAGIWVAAVGVAESVTTWSRAPRHPLGSSEESIS